MSGAAENIDLTKLPAAPAPPGDVNNLVDPYSQQMSVIICIAICLAVVVPMVFIRVFTKSFVVRKMQIEDYSLVISLLALLAYCAITIWAGDAGQGKHIWNVSVADVMQFAFRANYLEILYPIIMFGAKFAVLKQQERIFTGTRKDWIYWTLQVMIYMNAIFAFGIFISFIAACVPRAKIGNPMLDGICINTNASILATSGINIVSDWACLILPAIAVHRLNLKPKQKLGITAIFAIGLLACIASIVRLAYSVQLTQTHDVTWAIEPVGIWAVVEFSTVILTACFPSLPRFVKFVRFGRRGETTAAVSKQSGNAYSEDRSWHKRSHPMQSLASRSDIGEESEKLYAKQEPYYYPGNAQAAPYGAMPGKQARTYSGGINKTVQIQQTYTGSSR